MRGNHGGTGGQVAYANAYAPLGALRTQVWDTTEPNEPGQVFLRVSRALRRLSETEGLLAQTLGSLLDLACRPFKSTSCRLAAELLPQFPSFRSKARSDSHEIVRNQIR